MSLLCRVFGHIQPPSFDLRRANRLALGAQDIKLECVRCGDSYQQCSYVLYRDQIGELPGPARRWRGVMFIVRDRPAARADVVRFLRDMLGDKFSVDVSEIGEDTDLGTDLGASSLGEVEAIMLVEENYVIDLNDLNMRARFPLTVGKIADLACEAMALG